MYQGQFLSSDVCGKETGTQYMLELEGEKGNRYRNVGCGLKGP